MVGLGISFKKRGKEEKGKNEKRRIGEKEKRRIEEKKERRKRERVKRRIGGKDEKGEKKKRRKEEKSTKGNIGKGRLVPACLVGLEHPEPLPKQMVPLTIHYSLTY